MSSNRNADSAIFPHVSTEAFKEGVGVKYANIFTTTPNGVDVDIAAYWHIPSDPDEMPYLVVDIDTYGPARVKVCVNDGTVHDTRD